MKKVYVAGPYSGPDVGAVLRNIGRGEAACAELFLKGFAPFCPWHDKTYAITNYDVEVDVEQYYAYSMEWLKVSDCIFLVKGWENSKGTLLELKEAEKLGIPSFEDMDQMIKWSKIAR